jgi:penicillin-binding protein 1A
MARSRLLTSSLFVLPVTSVVLVVVGIAVVLATYVEYARGLPDHRRLADYEPATVSRVEMADGQRLAEYATEHRVVVSIETVPKRVIDAFLAAEDKNFFTHSGVDLRAIARAAIQNVLRWGEDRRPLGASTITQQVAKRFFLTNEATFTRKIKEAILAGRLERDFSKEKILELYLNDIYLGRGLYGVAAAAQGYFGKPLAELSLDQAAFLAALPKAPNSYNPDRFAEAAKGRRNWVLARMVRDGRITVAEAEAAQQAPLATIEAAEPAPAVAGYFAEEVRRDLVAKFGDSALYTGGLTVRSTLDVRLQAVAERALRSGLIAYDRRHGWRGRFGRIELSEGAPDRAWADALAAQEVPAAAGSWKLAVVLAVDDKGATVGMGPGTTGRLPFAELRWARPQLPNQALGPVPRRPADVLARGDLVFVEPVEVGPDGKRYAESAYGLRQIPEVSGAIVALEPKTGRVVAMSGGYQFERSRDEFNRATQARRQPGSAFKPFVYLAAMSGGFTPSTRVSDDPIVLPQGGGTLADWEPANFDGNSMGLQPLRVGLEQSRNVMTVRIAERLGMTRIARTAERFGIVDKMTPDLAMALGSGETTLLRLTTAYAELANGGYKVTPSLIEWVRDRRGGTLFNREETARQTPPQMLDDPRSIFQVVTMLRGVVERGTGRKAASLGRGIVGKTGTTNDAKDAWFVGFTTELVCGVYVGFDQPRSLGAREQGGAVALPVFVDFMKTALTLRPGSPFRMPEGVTMVRVRESDGLVAEDGESGLSMPFKLGTLPQPEDPVLEDADEGSYREPVYRDTPVGPYYRGSTRPEFPGPPGYPYRGPPPPPYPGATMPWSPGPPQPLMRAPGYSQPGFEARRY